MNENKTNINWFPGHMAKTRREIQEKLNLVDIIYEVVDSRMPYSSKIIDIDNLIKDKPRVIIFTKYDLCDKEETNKFIDYYKSLGYIVISVDLLNDKDIVKKVLNASSGVYEKLTESRKNKGLKPRSLRALVIGVPNVGKSTLINRLVGKKAAGVGNKPGVTKSLNTIKINEYMDLVDTPGILWPRLDNHTLALNLASMTIIKEEVLSITEVAIHILKMLDMHYKDKLKEFFGIDYYSDDDVEELFTKISKYKNIPIKNEIDYEKISLQIINMIKQEKLKKITFDIM